MLAPSEIDNYLQTVLARLSQHYSAMGAAIGQPIIEQQGADLFFRYAKWTDGLVCFLKGVKLVSTLNAALVLQRHGYANEIGALCRMADDFAHDILFMIKPADGTNLSEDQKRFAVEFFKEEFGEPDYPLSSSQKRETVSKRKIAAAFGRLATEHLNPSDTQDMLMAIHRAFSGYVHGAYPQIMELYGGDPPGFHMAGMLGTRREEEGRRQLVTYVYRAVMASTFVAHKLGLNTVAQSLRELVSDYEGKLDCRVNADLDVLIRNSKRPR